MSKILAEAHKVYSQIHVKNESRDSVLLSRLGNSMLDHQKHRTRETLSSLKKSLKVISSILEAK